MIWECETFLPKSNQTLTSNTVFARKCDCIPGVRWSYRFAKF